MPDDGVVSSTVPRPTGRPNARLRQTVIDMVISLGVVLALVAGIMLITWRPSPEPVKVVDVAQMLTAARAQADFAVVVPIGVEGLQATSVRWQPTDASGGLPVWHVGYVLDGDAYLQVSQSRAADAQFVAEQTAGGQATGTADIAGVTWEQRETADRRSLVRVDGSVTTIVSGTTDWERLVAVASALSAA